MLKFLNQRKKKCQKQQNLKGRDINDTIEHWNNKVKGFWLLIIFK